MKVKENANREREIQRSKNYIVEIVRPLQIHWYIDFDCSSFSFGTVAQNVELILLFTAWSA